MSKGDFLKVDLQNGKILNETTGKELEAEPLGEYVLNILQSGGIKPLVKKQLLGK